MRTQALALAIHGAMTTLDSLRRRQKQHNTEQTTKGERFTWLAHGRVDERAWCIAEVRRQNNGVPGHAFDDTADQRNATEERRVSLCAMRTQALSLADRGKGRRSRRKPGRPMA